MQIVFSPGRKIQTAQNSQEKTLFMVEVLQTSYYMKLVCYEKGHDHTKNEDAISEKRNDIPEK